jgi:hypothetical protein
MRTVKALRNPRIVFEHLNAANDIDNTCLLNRFPRIKRLEFRELLISISQQRSRASQNGAAFGNGHCGPRRKRRASRSDCCVDETIIRSFYIADHMARAGVPRLKCLSRRG